MADIKIKKIGLVGGTGPESTLMYYKELNSRIDALTGGQAMPDVAIESVNFRRAWEYVTSSDKEALSDYLAEKVRIPVIRHLDSPVNQFFHTGLGYSVIIPRQTHDVVIKGLFKNLGFEAQNGRGVGRETEQAVLLEKLVPKMSCNKLLRQFFVGG